MPRKPRAKSSTQVYHIMTRGINRQTIFEEEKDKYKYLSILKKYKTEFNFELYAYCLMDNHVHLLIKESKDATISEIMKRMNVSYVFWYNKKYERTGPLFQDRFKSENVESLSYFRTVLRYIHQNPLKAGIENSIFHCKWTSIKEYVSTPFLIDTEPVLKLFSPNKEEALEQLITFMKEENDDECMDDFPKLTDQEVKKQLYFLGVRNKSELQRLDKTSRNAILLKLKNTKGISINQLARLTGISKSVIQRIK
ncbi:transposase [Fervidibacillus halotolerans]|uniref:Transposase n=1 Tax=Fervidibacillus halotolerans TaxID=2980027 RepID=A0A9E8M033_9BACI|nr:transposase [Fervidibacillus halotolerans]WAA12726.1 transposase [Fervidibacillus halotolerans]